MDKIKEVSMRNLFFFSLWSSRLLTLPSLAVSINLGRIANLNDRLPRTFHPISGRKTIPTLRESLYYKRTSRGGNSEPRQPPQRIRSTRRKSSRWSKKQHPYDIKREQPMNKLTRPERKPRMLFKSACGSVHYEIPAVH